MVKLLKAQGMQAKEGARGEATCNPAEEDVPPIAAVWQRRQRQPGRRRRCGLLRALPLLSAPHRRHGRRGDQGKRSEDSKTGGAEMVCPEK
jgi:hypothetical protein